MKIVQASSFSPKSVTSFMVDPKVRDEYVTWAKVTGAARSDDFIFLEKFFVTKYKVLLFLFFR